MVRSGERRRVFGDADLGAEHGAERQWHAQWQLYVLNNTNVNLNTGAVSSNLAYNFLNTGPANYNFNPISTGTPTISANNHPNLALQGYVGGMMVTASGGSAPPFKNYTPPYIVTNVSGTPGDVSIYLPGNSSQMGAVFNVASVNAPAGGLSTASYLFGSYSPSDPSNTAGKEHGARHVCRSVEFCRTGGERL